ncbi:UNVERIFIED_CONTAM: Prolyl endopeptidase [Sesamum radiatum]|uniref:Prolyl endopeptidase n=1 Tax=Sesamum radiatum TaxID=300843 RepID=A0AAW2M377_SESRA
MGSLSAFDGLLQYPVARRDESVVDNYHGVKVPDPYRCRDKEFVEKQMKLTDSVLKTCETREKLREKLTKLYDFPKYTAPFRQGDKYFYFHNTGLQPQTVLYVQDSLDGKPEVLLDPNTLSDDGTVALSAYAVSEDAKYLAYGTSSSGSDWVTIKVLRIADKSTEPDTVSWVKFSSISWTHDGKGFFYSRYPAPKEGEKLDAGTETQANLNHEIYYHFLGTDQSEDILCWSDPENPKHTLSASVTEDGKYVLLYIGENCDPVNKVYYCDLLSLPKGLEGYKGKKELLLLSSLLTSLRLPMISEISSRRKDSIIFVGFTSFLIPGIIYTCNLQGEVPDMRIFREIVVPGFDRSEFEASQVFVPSKDGTKIPIFIVARKGLCLDGSHPCLLYGYGGFNISITPYFTASRILIAKHLDGVFCIATYVEEETAEYLVSAGYTQPKKLCIEGGSNGGLLVGACINQRPDLFGCALAHVGVMDMLRFHKFTIGHAWTSDYGCSDKEEEFNWLIKYSPLHNVRRPWDKPSDKATQYPCTMLLTADHDDRVVPLHSLKLLATMQHVLCTSVEKSPQTNPIIGRIEQKAGHGAGMPTQKIIDEAADRYAFMAKVVDATWID